MEEPAWAAARYDAPPRSEMPMVVLRLALEVALIIAVAVIAGVAHLRPVVIVALMAGAFLIVALSEWLAGRARFVPPAVAFQSSAPIAEGEPAPYVEAPAPAWGITDEPDEETEPEALTIVASAEEVDAASAPADPWERGPEGEDGDEGEGEAVPVSEAAAPESAEPEVAGRAGLFRRRRH